MHILIHNFRNSKDFNKVDFIAYSQLEGKHDADVEYFDLSQFCWQHIECHNNGSVDIGCDDGDDDNVVVDDEEGLDDGDYVDNNDGDDFTFSRFVAGQVSGIEGWPRNFSSQVQRLVEFLPDFASIGKIGLTLTTTSNYDLLFCWVYFNLGWFRFFPFVSVIKLSFSFHILNLHRFFFSFQV